MPTSQEMQAMRDELIQIAQTIETKVNLLAAKQDALETAKETKEQVSAALLSPIAGNNILYRNDDQRRSAFIESKALSNDYLSARDTERTAMTDKTAVEAEIEKLRKTYRAKELLYLFYSNKPNEQILYTLRAGRLVCRRARGTTRLSARGCRRRFVSLLRRSPPAAAHARVVNMRRRDAETDRAILRFFQMARKTRRKKKARTQRAFFFKQII